MQLGFNMNLTRLVQVNGQVRFLSQDFLPKGRKLIHGVEILAEYFEDREFIEEINRNRRERREYLTFELVEEAITNVYPKGAQYILGELVKVLLFDAIIGNNDRHFYNWALIGDVIKKRPYQPPGFAPIYDSARGLLWNKTDAKIKQMYSQFISGSDEIEHHINKSKPRISYEINNDANHFELIRWLSRYNDKYQFIINKFITKDKEENVIKYLYQEFRSLLITERIELIAKILKLRFSKIRSQVQ